MEKPEELTTLRRNEIFWVNFRITRHLHGQPESARSGQVVRFFKSDVITMYPGIPEEDYMHLYF